MPDSFKLNIDTTSWRGKRTFTLLGVDLDPVTAFIDVWSAWRRDPERCDRLHFVAQTSLESLGSPDALAVPADASGLISELISELSSHLADAWPMHVAGVHRLEFDAGRVVLTLAIGAIEPMLSKLWLRADAFYLRIDEHDAAVPWLCKALARLAGEHATVRATRHPLLRRSLENAGFVCDEPPAHDVYNGPLNNISPSSIDTLSARFAPRWRVRRHEPPVPERAAIERNPAAREAIVVGGGLAGCAITERLAARGWRVTLIERHDGVAQDASGNPAGVFHPIVWRDDSVAARLTRAGFLHALRRWSALERSGHDLGRSTEGLLQIADTPEDASALAHAIARFGYPDDYVMAVDQAEASRIAGTAVSRGGWFFPHGGAISPAALCAAQCAAAGDRLTRRFNTEVARLQSDGETWIAFDTHGLEIARAPVVVIANAGDAQRLAHLHGDPTRGVRGQLTLLGASPLDGLRVPVVGEGYAVPFGAHHVAHRTLIGATYDIDDADRQMRPDGHIENLERVMRMLPALGAREPSIVFDGRVAFRSVTSDRMPMIGALVDEPAARADAAKLSGAWPLDLPRAPGLYGAFAFGSRGLVWSALGAELIAAQIEGEPWPIERDLAEAIDPGRFLLRALRHGEFG
jgi:tRNA 5-methylaminomethyl-2-thiouridine biosynthesis bifunctional protein